MIDWLINFVVERPDVVGIALVLILFDVTPISKYTDKFFWRWCMVFRVPEKDRKTFRKGFKRTAWAHLTARRKTETETI